MPRTDHFMRKFYAVKSHSFIYFYCMQSNHTKGGNFCLTPSGKNHMKRIRSQPTHVFCLKTIFFLSFLQHKESQIQKLYAKLTYEHSHHVDNSMNKRTISIRVMLHIDIGTFCTSSVISIINNCVITIAVFVFLYANIAICQLHRQSDYIFIMFTSLLYAIV